MINEEAIEFIEIDISRLWNTPQNLKHKEALEMARDALKQKYYTDSISRQAVLDLPRIKTHNQWGNVIKESVDVEDIRRLSSVTLQEPKTGHWIFCENLATYWKEVYKCSECNEEITKTGCWNHHSELEKYCPNCGAKMTGSEEKEGD